MILPKNIWTLLEEKQPVSIPTTDTLSPVRFSTEGQLSSEECTRLVDWILVNEEQHPCLKEWLEFLRRYRQTFTDIAKGMGRWNDESTHSLGHDKWAVGWASDAMLPMASALFALKSFEIEGAVLECGAFKGSSTACLSLVCEELGFELDCADSFEGLPSEEGHYGKGDFLGTLDEVKNNVSRFGKLEHVNFVKGWYSDTLKDYSKPLALLWIDVDLQESTMDVLKNVYSDLVPDAVIFSDGFSEDVDFIENQIAHTGGEPAGFFRYFKENQINYCAAPGGSKGLAMIIPRESSDLNFVIPPKCISALIERL